MTLFVGETDLMWDWLDPCGFSQSPSYIRSWHSIMQMERKSAEGGPYQIHLGLLCVHIHIAYRGRFWSWTNSGMSSAISWRLYRESCDILCSLSFLFRIFSTCWEFRACRTGRWDVGVWLVMFFLYTFAVVDKVHSFSTLWSTDGQVRVYCRSEWCLLFPRANSQVAVSFPR